MRELDAAEKGAEDAGDGIPAGLNAEKKSPLAIEDDDDVAEAKIEDLAFELVEGEEKADPFPTALDSVEG